MDWSPPGSSVHGIFQVRIPQWVALSFSRNLPQLGIEPVSSASLALAGRFLTTELPAKSIAVLSSVQFSRSVVSNSLRPHELQHTGPPCPLPTPRVYSNSCPLSRWCHPAISSSVVPFFSCPQSLPASASFPIELTLRMRWPKYWSFSFSIGPSNEPLY